MNKNLLVVLPGLLLLGACVAARPPGAAAPVGCKPASEKACSHGTRVNVNLEAASGPEAVPECITVKRGDTLQVFFKPGPAAPGRVVTIPQSAADGWLLGSNGTGKAGVDEIQLTVPLDAELKHYKYTILSNKGACADPRVHVER